jgi:hypothetical protein
MVVELILWGSLVEDAGPDQGKRVLRRRNLSVMFERRKETTKE